MEDLFDVPDKNVKSTVYSDLKNWRIIVPAAMFLCFLFAVFFNLSHRTFADIKEGNDYERIASKSSIHRFVVSEILRCENLGRGSQTRAVCAGSVSQIALLRGAEKDTVIEILNEMDNVKYMTAGEFVDGVKDFLSGD